MVRNKYLFNVRMC